MLFRSALDSPEVKSRILQLGGEIQKSNSDESQKFIEQQVVLWGRVIKERKIVID